jgi:hypothetical protein
MLAELAQHAAIMGEMGELYNKQYLHRDDYMQMTEIEIQWVTRCMGRPRYFYKMF